MYQTQVLVTKELPSEGNLYLHCLSRQFQDKFLKDQLSSDYSMHQNQDIYIPYMNQLTQASTRKENLLWYVNVS